MTGHNGEETFKALSSALNDLVRKSVREDFARQGWNIDACGLALEDVPEGLEVRVAPPDERVSELESRDIRLGRIGGKKLEMRREQGMKPWLQSRSRCTSSDRNLALLFSL
jgi:hypothetical protein